MPTVEPTATEAPPWQPPDAPGPWSVGARTEHIDDPRTGPLTLEVWYPAAPPPDAEIAPYPDLPLLPLPGVYRDVPATGADHPVILFSHGYGGMRHQSVFLTEHLAAHGFVVVGVDHRLNTTLDLDETQTAVVALRRPVDLQVAADHVLYTLADGGWLDGRVRDHDLGVVGHSFGAFTSLVTGGGLLDVEAALEACATLDPTGCDFFGGLDIDGAIPEPDPRVVASVLLAPGGWYAFGDAGLDAMTPTLTLGGRLDGDLPYEEEIRPTYEALGGPARLATFERAGHWGFTDLCLFVPVVDCAGEAEGFLDPAVVQEVTRTLVTAFLGEQLRADDRYDPWLDGSPFDGDPEVTWESR